MANKSATEARHVAWRIARRAAALSLAASVFAAAGQAHAADLDGPAFADGGGAYVGVVPPYPVPPPVPLPPPYVAGPRVVVTSPLSVGGAYIPIPGLNGPTGPSAYPILPFAFGYGY